MHRRPCLFSSNKICIGTELLDSRVQDYNTPDRLIGLERTKRLFGLEIERNGALSLFLTTTYLSWEDDSRPNPPHTMFGTRQLPTFSRTKLPYSSVVNIQTWRYSCLFCSLHLIQQKFLSSIRYFLCASLCFLVLNLSF